MSSTRTSSTYNGQLIILSHAIAFFGAYITITLSEQYRLCCKENRPKLLTRPLLLILMASSLGGVAIWSMHLIGMTALSLKAPNGDKLELRYDIGKLIGSLIIVIFMSYVGLLVSSRDKAYVMDESETIQAFIKEIRSEGITKMKTKMKNKKRLVLETLLRNPLPLLAGGTLTGTGVCLMHYIGMVSIVFDGEIQWNVGIVTASVLIAVVASTAGKFYYVI